MATNTTATATTHTGNGSTTNFAISFSFLANNEVDVTVAGVLKTLDTHYTISGSTVTFTSGNTPANGAAIKFQRDTNISAKKVDFQDGSVLTETDLDTNSDQVLFAQQEITDKLGGIEEGATGDQTAAEIRTLVESATDSNVFTDADHSKLNAIEASATADQTASEIRTLVESASDSNVFTDADHTKLNGIEASATADQTAAEIRTLVESATDSNVFTDADHTKLNAIEAGATADQTVSEIKSLIAGSPLDASHLAANSVDSSELVDGSIDTSHLSADCVDSTKIADNAIGSEHLQANSVGTSEIADAELTTLAGMQSGTASKLADSTALTADLADLNQLDGMAKQTTITDDDAKFPTSGAVVDYVAAQIAPLGGLEVIATDAAFPNTQPASGVVISIADAGGLVVNGSGTSTTGRTVGGSTVTINNFASNFNSSTVDAGVAIMVSSTGSGQIYNYHKATLKEADLLNLSNDINDFAARYRVTNGEPTSNNDEGDLIYDKDADKMKVYDSTTSAFKEVTSVGDFKFLFLCPTGGSGSPTINGSIATYDLRESSNSGAAASVTNAAQLLVSINGVVQKPNTGTSAPSEGFAMVDTNTIIFGTNLPTGAEVFVIQIGSAISLQVPADNTVSSAKIQNGSVTTAKIGDDQVTAAKISNNEDFNINSITVGKGANSVAGNTVLGESALDASVSGGNNTAVGKQALTENTTGTSNVAVGANALDANTTASYNTAVGFNSLSSNTTGASNTALGAAALNSTTTGGNNVGVGLSALQTNTTGGNNTGVGTSALQLNTTGGSNNAFGANSLDANTTGSFNAGFGNNALGANTEGEQNAAFGNNALDANTTGDYNAAFGASSLGANTTASNNTAVGFSALKVNTTGADNTAVGVEALDANTTASFNTAIGARALGANTTGSGSCAVGEDALLVATTGTQNNAMGQSALRSLTTGSYNIGLGANSLASTTTSNGNVAVGHSALNANTTGAFNVAIGHSALDANTTASDNVGVGTNSLTSNTTGNENTSIGADSLQQNTTGAANTAVGRSALKVNTTAGNNTAVGHKALDANTTGSENTAIGSNALGGNTTGNTNTACGRSALANVTTGDNNVGVGHDAGGNSTTGAKGTFVGEGAGAASDNTGNTCVGYRAGATMTGADAADARFNTTLGHEAGFDIRFGANNTCLGNNAQTSGQDVDNEVVLGNSSINVLRCQQQSISGLSDRRDKTDIVDLPVGLNFVDKLKPVKFKWNIRNVEEENPHQGTVRAGFIAQDFKALQENENATFMDLTYEGNSEKLEIKQGNLIPVLVKAIQELSAKVTALEAG